MTPERGDVVTERGVTALVMVVSLTEPALLTAGVTTAAGVLLWPGPTAAEEDAPLRGFALVFVEFVGAPLE